MPRLDLFASELAFETPTRFDPESLQRQHQKKKRIANFCFRDSFTSAIFLFLFLFPSDGFHFIFRISIEVMHSFAYNVYIRLPIPVSITS